MHASLQTGTELGRVVDLFGTVLFTACVPPPAASAVDAAEHGEQNANADILLPPRSSGGGGGGMLAVLRQRPRVEAGDLIALILT